MNSRDDSLPRYHPCHLHWVRATGVPLGLCESYRCTFPQSYSSCRFVASTTVTNLIRSRSQTCRVPGHCNQPQSVSWSCGGLDHCNQPQSKSWTYRGHCNQPQSVCHGPFVATVTKLSQCHGHVVTTVTNLSQSHGHIVATVTSLNQSVMDLSWPL